MSDDRLYQLRAGYAADAYTSDEPPNLDPLRALAERTELADAMSRLCDSYGRLPADDPTHEVMNGGLAQVLDALGYQVWPFGLGGAWIVTGRRGCGEEGGR